MPIVTLFPDKKKIEVNDKKFLLEQLTKQDIVLNSSCGGFGTCGDCKIKILKGYDHCSAPSYEEIKLLGNVFHITQERLSCQLKISGDVEIDISAHVHAPTRKKNLKIEVKTTKIRKSSTLVATDSLPENVSPKKEKNPEKQGGFSRPKRKF